MLKPLEIYIIWATPFILLARKQDHKIFAVIIEDIKKVLKLKQYITRRTACDIIILSVTPECTWMAY